MSGDIYEMNGLVRVQGRPGSFPASQKNKNWCYTFSFQVNTSDPVCALAITSEDTGSGPLPGFFVPNSKINAQKPDDKDVRPGITLKAGKFSKTERFAPDEKQPKVTRGSVDEDEPDLTEPTDEVVLIIDPPIEKPGGIKITLCFDEPLDENDFINFLPSTDKGKDGSINWMVSGDVKPATALTNAQFLQLIGTGVSAGASFIGKRKSNKQKRQFAAAAFNQSPALADLILPDASTDLGARIRNGGVGKVFESISEETIVRNIGAEKTLAILGTETLVRTAGADAIVSAATAVGIKADIMELLE